MLTKLHTVVLFRVNNLLKIVIQNNKIPNNRQKSDLLKCLYRLVVLRRRAVVSVCTAHFVIVPLNLICLHCLLHFLFE